MLWVTGTHGVVVDVAVNSHYWFTGGFQGVHAFVGTYISSMPDHVHLLGKFQHAVVYMTVIVREQQDFCPFFLHKRTFGVSTSTKSNENTAEIGL